MTEHQRSMVEVREVAQLVEEAHRQHWAAVLASTTRLTRDIDLAEDCTQDAFVKALRMWPEGVPDKPVAWLTTVARRSALDALRRAERLRRKLPLLVEPETATGEARSASEDQPADLLRLVFTCCHPALSQESQVALTLRLLCGLTTAEVAAVLLVKEPTAAARITRAKRKIAAAGVPFRLPDDDELPERLNVVLTVIHLVFTAGHTAVGVDLVRADLTGRAVDLARTLVGLLPDQPEPRGLLALLLLNQARVGARLDAGGDLVLLPDQDRSLWDQQMIDEGVALATSALRTAPGRFTLQAAIAGLHAVAPCWEATDWRQVSLMYDALMSGWPSPVVALNRVAARSLLPGPDLAALLEELDALAEDGALRRYSYLPAVRADVLARLGRPVQAAAAYDEALALCDNHAERRFLVCRRERLG